jgi:hypothetical protein
MAREAKKGKKKPQRPKSSSVRTGPLQDQRSPGKSKTATSPVPLEIGHPTKVIIFELETLAVDQGRKRVFDSAKQVLAGAGFQLQPMLFSKMGIESTPSAFLSGALQFLKVRTPSHPRLKAVFDSSCRKALCERPALISGLAGVIAKARAHGIKPVAISFLGEEPAGELMKATGLADMEVQLFHGKCWVVHPYSENLVNRIVNHLRVLPATCVTLVSSGAAAEAALCAGTRVVAVPDSFTSFQAFSGVDEVLDTWSPEIVESVLSLDGEGHG